MTTICAVKKDNQVAMAGDGQVTMGEKVIMKGTARKIRRIFDNQVLEEMFEDKLKQFKGNLQRAAIEMAKQWRSDRGLQKLEAMLIVMNKEQVLLVSGTGEVIEPDDGILTIGSGGNYALSAARGLLRFGDSNLTAEDIARESLKIASEIDIFTNDNIITETLA